MYQKSFFLLNFQTPIFYTLNLKILKSEIYFLFLFLKYTLFVETKEIIKKNPQAFRDLNLEKNVCVFFSREKGNIHVRELSISLTKMDPAEKIHVGRHR